MFNGIIIDIGTIVDIKSAINTDKILWIHFTNPLFAEAEIGASIACCGVCLTVIEIDQKNHKFAVQVSAETLKCTTLSQWHIGRKINLESSLKFGDDINGHLVYGHVDITAPIMAITAIDGSHEIKLHMPIEIRKYISSKGSIAIEGISLTINAVNNDYFAVNIIPHSWSQTNLQYMKVGDMVNVEVDMMARYIYNILANIKSENKIDKEEI